MVTRNTRPAFSLAEMMIALVILGFGLLVIGAALPVGLRYSRQSADQTGGERAAEYALDVIEQQIRMKHLEVLPEGPGQAAINPPRLDDVFRPRNPPGVDPLLPALDLSLVADWEPIVKVRPFLTEVIEARPRSSQMSLNYLGQGQQIQGMDPPPIEGLIEYRIRNWLRDVHAAMPDSVRGLEFDEGRRTPILSACSLVFPPPETYSFATDQAFAPTAFLANDSIAGSYVNDNSQSFVANSMSYSSQMGAMLQRIGGSRIVFSAFYRRVQYDGVGPDGQRGLRSSTDPAIRQAAADNVGVDANLYEIIVVAVRKPSSDYRFAIYGFNAGGALVPSNNGGLLQSAAPAPMMIEFREIPDPVGVNGAPGTLNSVQWDDAPGSPLVRLDRRVSPKPVEPQELIFKVDYWEAQLLPPGSYFIPAVNDDAPSFYGADGNGSVFVRQAGFAPHVANAAPIYKVKARQPSAGGGLFDIVVENNGFYPWVNRQAGATERAWPAWVVPQPHKETQRTGQGELPIYDNANHIVTISRRVIRLPEVE